MKDARESVEAEIAASISETQEGFLLGFVVVAEWMGSDGERYISRCFADGTGDITGIPVWQMRGYLNEALNHWDSLVEIGEEDADEED